MSRYYNLLGRKKNKLPTTENPTIGDPTIGDPTIGDPTIGDVDHSESFDTPNLRSYGVLFNVKVKQELRPEASTKGNDTEKSL